jgi:hypothetical protein
MLEGKNSSDYSVTDSATDVDNSGEQLKPDLQKKWLMDEQISNEKRMKGLQMRVNRVITDR